MVSTEKCYASDNFPALHQAVLREEYLYQVRLYSERAAFLPAESGMLRMRILLGFIEAKAAVIDAVIKTDGTLHYLSVICASSAHPLLFSRIMKRIVPNAIIEEIQSAHAEERVATRSVREEAWGGIPRAKEALGVNESKRFLYTLLLEYRALLTECAEAMRQAPSESRTHNQTSYTAQILVFESGGTICGIPDFQVERITAGANGSHILELMGSYAKRILIAEELVCYKEIDIIDTRFIVKAQRGFYRVSTRVTGGDFTFNLVIPSFL
jgi:hypothetical protein